MFRIGFNATPEETGASLRTIINRLKEVDEYTERKTFFNIFEDLCVAYDNCSDISEEPFPEWIKRSVTVNKADSAFEN